MRRSSILHLNNSKSRVEINQCEAMNKDEQEEGRSGNYVSKESVCKESVAWYENDKVDLSGLLPKPNDENPHVGGWKGMAVSPWQRKNSWTSALTEAWRWNPTHSRHLDEVIRLALKSQRGLEVEEGPRWQQPGQVRAHAGKKGRVAKLN